MTLAATIAGDPPSERNSHPADIAERLEAASLAEPVDVVARSLLGARIVRDDGEVRRVAMIVETEAYGGPEDRASHARAGRTPRTTVMYGPAGRAYVYLVYGMHHCLNVVCGADGEAAAVLIRAVEPLAGIETMRARRGVAAGPDLRLGAGPARTCQALDIDRALDGVDLLSDGRLWLAAPPGSSDAGAPSRIVSGPRIGVDYAGPGWVDRPWRLGIAGHASLSRPFPQVG